MVYVLSIFTARGTEANEILKSNALPKESLWYQFSYFIELTDFTIQLRMPLLM